MPECVPTRFGCNRRNTFCGCKKGSVTEIVGQFIVEETCTLTDRKTVLRFVCAISVAPVQLYAPRLFNKRPAVHIAHVRNHIVTFLDPQNIKTTDKLFKHEYDSTRNFLFTVRQNDGKAHFLAVGIAFHLSIDCG